VTSGPIMRCSCVERYVATWEEVVPKNSEIVRVKIQFECCECGRWAVVKILDDKEKP
jgi:hypothetical protein